MGAINFDRASYGKTLKEAYERACEDATNEVGHQEGYSGDINST